MRGLLYAALCSVLLFTAACNKDDSPSTPNASTATTDYWLPAAVGSRSLLEGSVVSKMGGLTVDSTWETLQFTMLSGTKTTLDGKTASTLQVLSTSDGSMDTTMNYIVATAASIMLYEENLDLNDASTLLKAPLTVGNSWKSKSPNASSTDSTVFTIASVTETVATPAGTYQNCVQVRALFQHGIGDIPMTQDMYYAKGIGIVRITFEGSGTIEGVSASYKSDLKLKSKSF